MQVEVQVDDDLHRDGMALILGRLEFVPLDRFDGLLIETHSQVTSYMDVLRIPLRVHDELNRNVALEVFLASLLCEFRLDRINDLRRAHASANPQEATPRTSSAAGAHADAVAGAHTSSEAMTES